MFQKKNLERDPPPPPEIGVTSDPLATCLSPTCVSMPNLVPLGETVWAYGVPKIWGCWSPIPFGWGMADHLEIYLCVAIPN